MAHHGSGEPSFLRDLFKERAGDSADDLADDLAAMREKLGPSGKFPQGKLDAADDGEIRIGITRKGNKVIMAFGTEVSWIGFDRKQALAIGNLLIERGFECAPGEHGKEGSQ